MSKFGSTTKDTTAQDPQKPAEEPTQATGTASASQLMDQREKTDPTQQATQDEVAKAHQQMSEALQQQANKIHANLGQEPSLTTGNVTSGAITTNNSALSLLNSLGAAGAASGTGPRPAGYYTVHAGSLKGKNGRIRGQSIAGLFYYDPSKLDAEATAAIKKLVVAGMASYEGGKDDADSATE